MEVMSDILRAIRVSGSVYFCSQVEAPWTKNFHDAEQASFHMIRRGTCWASVDGYVERLEAGDLIFLGPGQEHVLSSQSPVKGSPILKSQLCCCVDHSASRARRLHHY